VTVFEKNGYWRIIGSNDQKTVKVEVDDGR
jgi:hypothetical protein